MSCFKSKMNYLYKTTNFFNQFLISVNQSQNVLKKSITILQILSLLFLNLIILILHFQNFLIHLLKLLLYQMPIIAINQKINNKNHHYYSFIKHIRFSFEFRVCFFYLFHIMLPTLPVLRIF